MLHKFILFFLSVFTSLSFADSKSLPSTGASEGGSEGYGYDANAAAAKTANDYNALQTHFTTTGAPDTISNVPNQQVYDPLAPVVAPKMGVCMDGSCSNSPNVPGISNSYDPTADPKYRVNSPTGPGPVFGGSAPTGPDCTTAIANARNECMGFGKGAMAAAGIQGTSIVINASGNNANSSCSNTELAALANNAGNAVIAASCYHAAAVCQTSCSYDPNVAQCSQIRNSFYAQMGAQVLSGAAQAALAAKCKDQTNNPLANSSGMPDSPYNQQAAAQPNNDGPAAQNTPAKTLFGGEEGGSGNGSAAAGGAAYPGGPAGNGNQAAAGSGINNPSLGLSGGSGGGGWPTGGGGNMNGGRGGGPGSPFDLASLLPGQKADPARNPANAPTEVTGPNDLTNFQKVTRTMNRKRVILKSGDGA